MQTPTSTFALSSGSIVPEAMLAAKEMALQASSFADASSSFASSAASTAFAQWLWKACPEWLKDDISFKNLLRNKGDVTMEDITNMGDVIDKLEKLSQSPEINVTVPQLHAALLAYIQLFGQIKEANMNNGNNNECIKDETETRDYMYRSTGKPMRIERLWEVEFREALKFSTFAYYKDTKILRLKLRKRGFELVAHDLSLKSGYLSYYLAVSAEQEQVILGLAGNSILEELLNDCCGRAVPLEEEEEINIDNIEISFEGLAFEDSSNNNKATKSIRCHEGLLISSKRLFEDIEIFIQEWVIEKGWHFMLCGHSLGAGAATLTAVLARSKFPELASDDNDQIAVYAFGPPPVLDETSALAASSYCASFVHNADIIPRCSLYNLTVFLECLKRVHERLVELDMNPTGALSTAAFINKLSQGTSGEPLLDASQLNECINDAQQRVTTRRPEQLFIPGRVLLSFNPWSDQLKSNEIQWDCIETVGTAKVFRTIELDGGKMFTDHVISSYYEVLNMDYSF